MTTAKTALKPDLRLQRVPEFKLYVDSSSAVQILTDSGTVWCGPYGLTLLDAFTRPRPVREVLDQIQPQITGVQDWLDLAGTLLQLHKAGVLREQTEARPAVATRANSFASPPIHIAMLNDTTRTAGFLAAIREVVRPGDVVVDIGTGTGILAVAAARAGARHVYAIEASAIGKGARAVFEANGLADRITLLEGWSTQLTLPERADVLVSEIIGNDPLGESILEYTRDALQRLLKPGARLVPGRLRLFGLPITIPRDEVEVMSRSG